MMKVLVITGGIGSGKSLACTFLEKEYGWPVYTADSRVKDLYENHDDLVVSIEDALAGRFRDEYGHFIPAALASVIFTDRSALEKVESIVFPFLTGDFLNWKSQQTESSYVILESATILEKPSLRHLGDITLLIDAPLESRVMRAAERDGVSAGQVRRRTENQPLMNSISEGDVKAPVDVVIVNDSTEKEFYEKLRIFAENLLEQKC